MRAIGEQIMNWIGQQPEGTVVSARGLLHLGSRPAVDQALARLARQGQLARVSRGRYVRPIETRFGTRAPAPEKVLESLALSSGETIVPSGAAEANALGLTTQVPVRRVYLTSGRSRKLHLGRETIELRHARAWQLMQPCSRAGQAVRAMAWMGEEHVDGSAARLKSRLSTSERKELAQARGALPTWMAQSVSKAFVTRTGKLRASHG